MNWPSVDLRLSWRFVPEILDIAAKFAASLPAIPIFSVNSATVVTVSEEKATLAFTPNSLVKVTIPARYSDVVVKLSFIPLKASAFCPVSLLKFCCSFSTSLNPFIRAPKITVGSVKVSPRFLNATFNPALSVSNLSTSPPASTVAAATFLISASTSFNPNAPANLPATAFNPATKPPATPIDLLILSCFSCCSLDCWRFFSALLTSPFDKAKR